MSTEAAESDCGAGRGNRTLMVSPPRDFESRASTNSAIPARPTLYGSLAVSTLSRLEKLPRDGLGRDRTIHRVGKRPVVGIAEGDPHGAELEGLHLR